MPIDHSSCGHERTPKARAACRRAQGAAPLPEGATRVPNSRIVRLPSETPREATKSRRANDDTRTTLTSSRETLKALNDAPARVRDFIERCHDRGFKVNPTAIEVGYSIEVYSSRGAGRVTWEGERTAWFTRLGYTSITTRVTNVREVWKVLTGGQGYE